MSMIYLDPASIHNEMLKRHSEIDLAKSQCSLCVVSTTDPFARVHYHMENLPDGTEVTVVQRDQEDYYGFAVELVRWGRKRKARRGRTTP